MKEVNFLDVTLDLRSGLYKPYNKPNDTPLYVHKNSNHPPSILKNPPLKDYKKNYLIWKQGYLSLSGNLETDPFMSLPTATTLPRY